MNYSLLTHGEQTHKIIAKPDTRDGEKQERKERER